MSEEQQPREFTGIWIPKAIVEDTQLNWTDRAVFCEIACFTQCFMTNETLAHRVGVSAERVRKIIANLKKLGYVQQVGFDGRKRYLQAYTSRVVENDLEGGRLRPGREVENDQAGGSKMTTIDNNRENNLNNSEAVYRKRLQLKPFPKIESIDDIEVGSEWQSKAKYVASRLGTQPKQISSVLKACKTRSEYEIDTALQHAADATVNDKTGLFFKALAEMRMSA